jgi:hypothetical protein
VRDALVRRVLRRACDVVLHGDFLHLCKSPWLGTLARVLHRC